MGASTPVMYGVQGTDFAPLQSMGASTPTMYDAQEFYSESMGVHTPTTLFFFTLMFIHPDTPNLVSTGTNPSLTYS